MRFTDAHAAASVCTPTRYSLMTGQYAWRHRAGGVDPQRRGPAERSRPRRSPCRSSSSRPATPRASSASGTSASAQPAPDYNRPITPGPREVGFDYSFIIPATGDRVPCVYVEDGRVVGYDPKDPIQVSYGKPIGDEPTGADHPELLKVKPSHGHDNTIVNGDQPDRLHDRRQGRALEG